MYAYYKIKDGLELLILMLPSAEISGMCHLSWLTFLYFVTRGWINCGDSGDMNLDYVSEHYVGWVIDKL